MVLIGQWLEAENMVWGQQPYEKPQVQCLSHSAEWWLHHFAGPDEGGLVMPVTRGKVSIFLCQLLGLQPDGRWRGCDYDLVPKRSFPPEKGCDTNRFEKCEDLHELQSLLNNLLNVNESLMLQNGLVRNDCVRMSEQHSKIPANAIQCRLEPCEKTESNCNTCNRPHNVDIIKILYIQNSI